MDQIKAVFTQLLFVGLMGILSLSVYGNYDPQAGRFLQRDPIGTAPRIIHTSKGSKVVDTQGPVSPNPALMDSQTLIISVNSERPADQQLKQNQYDDGINLYQYVISNPMFYIDPFGLLKLDRESCIKCRWAGDRPYREKFRDIMMSSMRKSCDAVSKLITDPTLAGCISKMCNEYNVKCTMGKCGYGGSVDYEGTVEICPDEFDRSGKYKSKRTGDIFTGGGLLIHEFAHKCGWQHGKGNGVPDPGYNDKWPY